MTGGAPVDTADPHYFEVKGRRWRRTDPAIPDPLRRELVRELMAARRSVKAALAGDDASALRRARGRVNDAKVALGERGPRYWEPLTDDAFRLRAQCTSRALARARGARGIRASEVARIISPESYRSLIPLVRREAAGLCKRGVLRACAGEAGPARWVWNA